MAQINAKKRWTSNANSSSFNAELGHLAQRGVTLLSAWPTSMRFVRRACCRLANPILFISLALAATSVQALDWSGLERLSGKVSVGLGNVFRGLQYGDTGLSPAAYLEKSWQSGLYTGLWMGRFDASGDQYREAEINYILGFNRRISTHLAVATSITHYQYEGNSKYRNYDWTEWLTRVQIYDQWVLGYGLGKDWFAEDEQSHFLKLTHISALPAMLELDISVGVIALEEAYINGYQYLEIGLERNLGRWNLRAQVSTTDSELRSLFGSSLAGPQGAITLSLMF